MTVFNRSIGFDDISMLLLAPTWDKNDDDDDVDDDDVDDDDDNGGGGDDGKGKLIRYPTRPDLCFEPWD